MSESKLCRICLNTDVKLFKLEQCNLKHYYEQITQSKILAKDVLPPYFCFECAALLHKYYKFQEKCEYGQMTLRKLMSNGIINYSAVADMLKNSSDLHSTLDYISFKCSKRIKTMNINYEVEMENNIELTLIPVKVKSLKNEPIQSDGEGTYVYEYILESDHDNDFIMNIKHEHQEMSVPSDMTKTTNVTKTIPLHSEVNPVIPNTNTDLLKTTPISPKTNPDLSKTNPNVPKAGNSLKQKDIEEVENVSMDIDEGKNLNNEKNITVTDKITTSTEKPTATNKGNEKLKCNKPKQDLERNCKFFGFKRDPKGELSKDNWETKLLTEEEAMEQFRKKEFDKQYKRMDFKCTKCFKGFSKNDMLLRHNKKWHEKGEKKCRFCHMQFRLSSELRSHLVHHYNIFKCLRCGLKFNLKNMAICHDGHHNGVIHKCKHCGEEYTHISSYYTHLRTWHKSPHACALCGATFVSEAGVRVHMKRKHILDKQTEEPASNIYCQKCEISFVSQRAYNEHLSKSKMHEGEKKERTKRRRRDILTNTYIHDTATCIHCKETFKSNTELKSHMSEEHPGLNMEDRVLCEICGASLASTYIEVHMNRRHTKKKIFPCETCGKEFLCAASYGAHQRTHTGERPYSCEICHKRFAQKGQRDAHYKHTHLKEPYPKRIYNRRNRGRQPSEVPLFTSLSK